MEYISPEGLRVDGRRPKELRKLRCELGVLASADGSAIFEMGNTKASTAAAGRAIAAPAACRLGSNRRAIAALQARASGSAMPYTQVLAAVFGPKEVAIRSQRQHDRAVVKCEYAMAAFSTGESSRPGRARGTSPSPALRPLQPRRACNSPAAGLQQRPRAPCRRAASAREEGPPLHRAVHGHPEHH
jgi:exosome complex component RRP41